MNPFGPQGANAAKSLPAGTTTIRYNGFDTWVKDCSANGATDGTALDASFFNNIIGNLTTLISSSGIGSVTRGDMTLVYRAVVKAAQGSLASGAGITIASGVVSSSVGKGTLPVVVA